MKQQEITPDIAFSFLSLILTTERRFGAQQVILMMVIFLHRTYCFKHGGCSDCICQVVTPCLWRCFREDSYLYIVFLERGKLKFLSQILLFMSALVHESLKDMLS